MKLFISHASEDKDEIARPLADELIIQDYEVWYDEYTLELGDSLSQEIEKGLLNCDFGVVILSKNFFRKNWTNRELSGLISKEIGYGDKFILPIWHKITYQEILNHSPTLANKIAVKSEEGIPHIIKEIQKAVFNREYNKVALIQEARKVAKYFNQLHYSVHRAAIRWCPNIVAVFGNDGYKATDKKDNPTFAFKRVQAFRKELKKLKIKELAFGTCEDNFSWAILLETDDVKGMNELIWNCLPSIEFQMIHANTTLYNSDEPLNNNCNHLKKK